MLRRAASAVRRRFPHPVHRSLIPPILFLLCFLLIASWARADYPQIRLNTDTTTELQNEEQVCVNPLDPDNVVACWRDFRLGYRRVGIGYSLDGGTTWTDYVLDTQLPWQSDPVLIAHRDGTFYLIVIDYENNGANQLLVYRSTNRGITWDAAFPAVYSSGATFEDKEWIAVDRTGGPRDGHLYVAWTRFNEVTIQFVRSTDRGETWSSPVQISDPGALVQWPVPIALRNGNVLVAWTDYLAPEISYDISTNGGVSWGTDRTLTSTTTAPQDQINGGITIFPYPSLALDETAGPRAGWIYCVYADRAISANGVDVWCRRSTDNGNNWSARVRVNNDPAGLNRDQFHPWVACDEQGVLTAIWYDRRDDPSNYLWHIYMSRSTDGGVTWPVNERITTVPSSPGDALAGEPPAMERYRSPSGVLPLESQRAGLIGEYSGVAVRAGVIHPVWTDTRNGHQDVYATRIADPSGVDGPLEGIAVARLRAVPNPFREATSLGARLSLSGTIGPQGEPASRAASTRPASIGIYDAGGRLVRRLVVEGAAAAGEFISWDGRDASGRPLPAGVYLARGQGAARAWGETRLVLVR